MDEKVPEPLSRPVEPTQSSANVAPELAHVAMTTSTSMGTPTPNVGKPGKGKRILAGMLIIALIASTAVFGYLWWEARSAQAQVAQSQKDKQEAENKLAEAQAKVSELEKSDGEQSKKTSQSDNDLILSVVKTYDMAFVNYQEGNVSYATPVVSAKDKNFATVAVSQKTDSTSKRYILKKVDQQWLIIVTDSEATISAQQRADFAIPADIK